MEKNNDNSYDIIFNGSLQTNDMGAKFVITFNPPITAAEAGILAYKSGYIDQYYQVILIQDETGLDISPSTSDSTDLYDSNYMEIGEYLSFIAAASCLGLSIAASNFQGLWLLISMYQVLMYLPLLNVGISLKYAGFMRGLRYYNPVPNILSDSGSGEIFSHAQDYGIDSSIFLTNFGEWFLIGFGLIALFLLTSIVGCSELKKIANYARFVAGSYMWNTTLRYFLMGCLDITIASLLQFMYITSGSQQIVINTTLAIISQAILLIFTYVLFSRVGQITQSPNPDRWSTVIEPAYQSEPTKHLYAPFFMLVRFTYACALTIGHDYSTLQLAAVIIAQFGLLVYTAAWAAFENHLKMVLAVLTESTILINLLVITVLDSDVSDDFIDFAMFLGIALVFLLSFLLVLYQLFAFYISCCRKRLYPISPRTPRTPYDGMVPIYNIDANSSFANLHKRRDNDY